VKLFGAMDSTWKNCINGLLTDNRTSLNGFKRNGTGLSVYFPMHLWTGLLSCLRGAPQRSEPGVGGGEAGPCSPLACCSLSLMQSSCCAYLGTWSRPKVKRLRLSQKKEKNESSEKERSSWFRCDENWAVSVQWADVRSTLSNPPNRTERKGLGESQGVGLVGPITWIWNRL
jgi:hypothetical protein